MLRAVRRALVIAAHPDDETLGAGGTIRRLVEAGAEVGVAIVTDGSSAQFGDDAEARARRNRHLSRACDLLGVTALHHGDLPDMALDGTAHVRINAWIAEAIRAFGCDTVFCHHPGDVNLDHGRVFESVLVATRPVPGQPVARVLSYFVGSSSEWGAVAPHRMFVPNLHVDISTTIETKIAALECYADELRDPPHPRSAEMVRARARVTGSEAGMAYAEAFHLVRWSVA